MPQKRVRIDKPVSKKAVEEVEEAAPQKSVDTEELKSEMDDILDEIDGVLEKNAEEFVNAYVQAGGQ